MTTNEIKDFILTNSEWMTKYNALRDKDDNTFEEMAEQASLMAEEVPSCTEEDITFIIEDMLYKMNNN